jgi:hypothetical protein
MDINTINHRKFNRICNTYSKKGYKEVDYRSKITYGFYGKKGYNKAYYYTKKNTKKSKTTKDKA